MMLAERALLMEWATAIGGALMTSTLL